MCGCNLPYLVKFRSLVFWQTSHDSQKRSISFFTRGQYPSTVFNGSQEIVLQNPWLSAGNNAAPFDQPFYLILDLAVGGTSGWFPDGVGGKPWVDSSQNAMESFARAQDVWSATWPSDANDRAFRMSVFRSFFLFFAWIGFF